MDMGLDVIQDHHEGHPRLDAEVLLEMTIVLALEEISTPTFLLRVVAVGLMSPGVVRLLVEGLLRSNLLPDHLRADVVEMTATHAHHEEGQEATAEAARSRLHQGQMAETELMIDQGSAVMNEADPRRCQKPLAHIHLDHEESALLLSHHAARPHHRDVASSEIRPPPRYRALVLVL